MLQINLHEWKIEDQAEEDQAEEEHRPVIANMEQLQEHSFYQDPISKCFKFFNVLQMGSKYDLSW
jgi:hypothetical protein